MSWNRLMTIYISSIMPGPWPSFLEDTPSKVSFEHSTEVEWSSDVYDSIKEQWSNNMLETASFKKQTFNQKIIISGHQHREGGDSAYYRTCYITSIVDLQFLYNAEEGFQAFKRLWKGTTFLFTWYRCITHSNADGQPPNQWCQSHGKKKNCQMQILIKHTTRGIRQLLWCLYITSGRNYTSWIEGCGLALFQLESCSYTYANTTCVSLTLIFK